MCSLERSKAAFPIANAPQLLTDTLLQAAEPGIIPQAAPLQDLAPDEDGVEPQFRNTDHNDNAGYRSDPEAGQGSDDDDEYPMSVSLLSM